MNRMGRTTSCILMGALVMMSNISEQATAQISLNVDLLDNWDDPNVLDNGFGAKYNEVWGFVQNGQEYGVIGSTYGTHIIEITATDQLIQIDTVPGALQGVIIHRHFDDHAGYLYGVCDQGPSTLQIIDLQYLPDSVVLVYNSAALFTTAHNIFIDNVTEKMYVFGPNGNAMSVYSLADPINPLLLSHFNEVNYVHDGFVRNDTAYLNAGGEGLFVYNFNNTSMPQLLGSLTNYPDQGYNHSGWLSEDGATYVFADETGGMRMKVCDVTDLTDITVESLFNSMQDPQTVPHNLHLKDDIVYVSHYNDGLQIFDISDKLNPVRVGFYDTYPGPDSISHFRGAWGIYAFLPSERLLISDRQTGLYLFNFNPPVSVQETIQDDVFTLFPNPSNGEFTVTFTEPMRDVELLITDAQGKRIIRRSFRSTQPGQSADLPGMALGAGVYFLTTTSTTHREVQRLVIE